LIARGRLNEAAKESEKNQSQDDCDRDTGGDVVSLAPSVFCSSGGGDLFSRQTHVIGFHEMPPFHYFRSTVNPACSK
jgi:hypothetical protein